jgi:hypothetical protein
MNYTNKLDIESLKKDELAFKELIGNTPARFGIAFQPSGLEGNSWTFFKSDTNTYLLQRKSSGEVLDIVGYAKVIGLSIEDLKIKFPHFVQESKPSETLDSWLSSHCLTHAEVEAKGWRINKYAAAYPIETDKGVMFHRRKFRTEYKKRFDADYGLTTGIYFYTPSKLKSTPRLIICAGAADCLNAYLAFAGEIDCIGIIGEITIPSELLKLKYDEYLIAYDNDEAGRKGILKLASKLNNVKVLNWSLFPSIKDISELATKHGREAIVQLIEEAIEYKPSEIQISANFTNSEWNEIKPFPNPLKPVMEFDSDFLPTKLQPFISDIAERMQCPIDFPAAALIVVLSSAIGRRIGIKPKERDNWIVIPNLWGMVIGRPSIMKTPAMKQPMSLLEYHENERFKQHREEKKEYDRNKPVYDAIEQEKKNQIKSAIKSNKDPFALVKEDSEIPPVPNMKRLITNDSTIEKLGELLSENEYGLLYFRDELHGFIVSFEKDGRESDRAFYLEGWNGDGRHTVDRIIRGTICIEAICVSILGGIQPGKLQNLVRQAVNGGTGDDGLLQRFQIAVWPDDLEEWRNIDKYPNTQAREQVRELVHSFLLLENGHSYAQEDKFNPVPFLSFDKDAQSLFNEWIEEHENQLRKDDIHPAIEAHLGKYRSLIPSLALIFQLADDIESSVVGELALSRAVAYSEYLKTHAIRIYESTTLGEIQAAKNLIRKIKKGDVQAPFTAREIQQKGWAGLNTPEMVKAVLGLLEDLNYLRSETKKGIGRSTEIYYLNPNLEVKGNE